MKKIKIERTLKEGYVNFYRNGWLSVATVTILAISLFIIGMTFLIGITGKLVLTNIQKNVNIAIYFNPEVNEENILEIKNKLEKYSEVESVKYISREQALSEFVKLEENNSSIKRALEEIGENPLLSSLVINASNAEQYEIIFKAIANSNFNHLISHVNYEQNKEDIEKVVGIIKFFKKIGLILGLIFVFLAILVTFNTIRMTIYSRRQEFEIMRLVGASNIYVEMPLVVESLLYGISAGIIALLMIFITAKYIVISVSKIFSQGELMNYYISHFWIIVLATLLSGIVLGVVSSFLAIRKYLKT